MSWADRVDALVDRACLRKRDFRNMATAWHERDKATARYGPEVEGVVPYRCPFCGRVHLGHPKKVAESAS